MSDMRQAVFENKDESQKKREELSVGDIHAERPKFCVHCGAPLEEDDEFCTECGERIENDIVVEEKKEKAPSVKISSDRMFSIMETARLKSGEGIDKFRKAKLPDVSKSAVEEKSTERSTLKLGYYVHKDSEKTQYLIIESICGSDVKASVKTTFVNGSYSTEYYTGTLIGDNLSLHISDTDLHPLPTEKFMDSRTVTKIIRYSIRVGESFSGIVSENKIAGNFNGELNQFVVFIKD